jgi:RNA polymerase sigma-70 factor (ECF subfamily)
VDFRKVYDENFAYIWTVLRRLGVFERELEDAVHDVFVVFHRRLDAFDASRPVKPWLCGIAARVASDFRRKASTRREKLDDEIEVASEERTPAEGAQTRRDRALVHRALERMDFDRRLILVLCELEGHTAPAVAEVLEVSVNTVYSRLRLARRDFAAAVEAVRGGGA